MRARPLTFLITAGPTVEDLDPVRFISNRATGKLGFAVARAALAAGHRAMLVNGPVSEELDRRLPRTPKLVRIPVRSCAEMHRIVLAALPSVDVVVMSAAVADFTPAKVSAVKIKKAQAGLVIRLKPTVDILKHLGKLKRRRKRPLVLIGFALETGSGRSAAQKLRARVSEASRKLESKNLDAIVLDTPAAMGAERAVFHVLRAGAAAPKTIRANKDAMAKRLVYLGALLHSNQNHR